MAESQAKKPRRVRRATARQGVKIIARTLPSGTVSYIARWTDPSTGKRREVSFASLKIGTADGRRAWAVEQSAVLAEARRRLALGKPAVEPELEPEPESISIESGIDLYLESARARLRKRTIESYSSALRQFSAWARSAGVRTLGELTGRRLLDLRDHLIALEPLPHSRAAEPAEGRRAATTVNNNLRVMRLLVEYWRKRQLVQVTRDDLVDAFESLPNVGANQPAFFAPGDLAEILAAAARHDARHRRPIGLFVAFLMLSGCRRGEALATRWEHVHLDARDHEGRAVGEIRLPAEITKTHRSRVVALEVSPMLRALLDAHRRAGGGQGYVFGGLAPYRPSLVELALRRLIDDHGAPRFRWKDLRSNAATYLTNAPGIFGSASAFLSAKQLGHSVLVSERHYANVHRGVARDARCLEAAMGVQAPLEAMLFALEREAEA